MSCIESGSLCRPATSGTQEPVADTLEQLWISYNQIEKLKGIGILKVCTVRGQTNVLNLTPVVGERVGHSDQVNSSGAVVFRLTPTFRVPRHVYGLPSSASLHSQ